MRKQLRKTFSRSQFLLFLFSNKIAKISKKSVAGNSPLFVLGSIRLSGLKPCVQHAHRHVSSAPARSSCHRFLRRSGIVSAPNTPLERCMQCVRGELPPFGKLPACHAVIPQPKYLLFFTQRMRFWFAVLQACTESLFYFATQRRVIVWFLV